MAMNDYDAGYDAGRKDVTAILTDLIADLLRSPFFSIPELDPVLDRAEARLREMQGE